MSSEDSSCSEEDVYEVEAIIDHVDMKDDHDTYYRVRWKGYEADSDTWEPKDNLLSCEDLLNTYIATHVKKKDNNDPHDAISSDDDSLKGQYKKGKSKKNTENKSKPKGSGRGRGYSRRRGRGRGRPAGKGRLPRRISSSDTDDDESDEEPQVKDPFWENLEKGKIDVFDGDLYSKVKRRRYPVERLNITHTQQPGKRGPKKKTAENVEKEVGVDSVVQETVQSRKVLATAEIDSKRRQDHFNMTDGMRSRLIINLEEIKVPKSSVVSPVLDYLEGQLEDKLKTKRPLKTSSFAEKKLSAVSAAHNTFGADRSKEDSDSSDISMRDNDVTPKRFPVMTGTKEKDQLPRGGKFSAIQTSSSDSEVAISDDDILLETKISDKKSAKLDNSKSKTGVKNAFVHSTAVSSDDDTNNADKTKHISPLREESALEKLEAEVPPTPDAFTFLLQGLDNIPSLPQRSRDRTRKSSKPSDLATNTDEVKHSAAAAAAAPPPPPPRRSSVMSMFETLEQEFQGKSSPSSSGSSNKSPLESRTSQNTALTAEPESSNAARKVLPDMAEFMKVKVNFVLDEFTPQQLEQHYDSGDPPSRMERDVTVAEFRQYIRSNNYEKVFEALKSKKKTYNLDNMDANCLTQLMISASNGFNEVVKILAHHGARVNMRAKTSQTALMFAAEKGHSITVRILLMYGAYVNMQTTCGDTALMKAVKYGHPEITHCLLQAGADPCLKTSQGVTAMKVVSRLAEPCINMVKAHQQNVEAKVEACVRMQLKQLGLRMLGPPMFGIHTFNIREKPLVHFNFPCSLINVPPNQGLMLFAVHGLIGSGLTVKCRLRGPCHVNAVTINNSVMEPMMPVKGEDKYSHFITNLTWRNGQNSLRLFVSQDGLSNEKLYVVAYQVGFNES